MSFKNKNGEERRPYFDRLSRYVNNQFAFSALGIDDGEQAQRRQTAETSGEPRQSGFVQTGRTATGDFFWNVFFFSSRADRPRNGPSKPQAACYPPIVK